MNKKISRLMTVIIATCVVGTLVFFVVCVWFTKPLNIATGIKQKSTNIVHTHTPNYKIMGMCGGLLRVAEDSVIAGNVDEKKFYFTCLVYLELVGDLLQKEKQQGRAAHEVLYGATEEDRLKKLFLWGEDFYKHKEQGDEKNLNTQQH